MIISKAYVSDFSDEEYNFYFGMSSLQRQTDINRKKSQNDKKASVLGEALAKQAISDLLNINLAQINFDRTINGKPFCKSHNVFFNISHSKDLVVCAVDNKNLGIDAEFIRDIDLRVTKFACNENDMAILDNIADETEKNQMFFQIWTSKEAYIKFHGMVLADIKDISFDDIKSNCQTYTENGYMITVYTEQ